VLTPRPTDRPSGGAAPKPCAIFFFYNTGDLTSLKKGVNISDTQKKNTKRVTVEFIKERVQRVKTKKKNPFREKV